MFQSVDMQYQSNTGVASVEAVGNKLKTYRIFTENYVQQEYVKIVT